MTETFGVRLRDRIQTLGPLCVGVDPSRRQLTLWERGDDISGLEFFSLAMLEASMGLAAAIKPQVAYFERFGSAGFRVLERLLSDARDARVLIVADAKRGDIGSTNEGYAEAWLTPGSPLAADALTVTPYLGIDTMAPLVTTAAATARGLFVVVASSNDEGRVVQEARIDDERRVEDVLLERIAEWNRADEDLGTVGVVFGATRDRPRFDLAHVNGPFLVPGVGEQGATPDHVARLFSGVPTSSLLVNVSRAIAGAGPDPRSVRDAVARWRDDLARALP